MNPATKFYIECAALSRAIGDFDGADHYLTLAYEAL
jgi:hypothetical protein